MFMILLIVYANWLLQESRIVKMKKRRIAKKIKLKEKYRQSFFFFLIFLLLLMILLWFGFWLLDGVLVKFVLFVFSEDQMIVFFEWAADSVAW